MKIVLEYAMFEINKLILKCEQVHKFSYDKPYFFIKTKKRSTALLIS